MIARPTADLYQILDLSYDPNEEFAPHTDELPRISIVLSGQLLETAGDKEEWASAASMVFKPGDLRHFNRFGREGARLVSVAFSEEGFRALCDPVENRSWRWWHGAEAAALSVEFLRALDRGAAPQNCLEAVIDLLAGLSPDAPGPMKRPPSWLTLLRERMQDEFQEPLPSQELAAWLDLHPVYLARVFREFEGCTVREYLRRIRLRRAIDRLASSNEPLAGLAYDCGFSDQSHLSRELKASVGQSPRQLRNILQRFSTTGEA